MSQAGPRLIRLLLGLAIVAASIGSLPAAASTASSGQTRMISASGSGGIIAGNPDSTTGVAAWETPGVGRADGGVVNRSHSGSGDSPAVGAITQPKNLTKSAPARQATLEDIHHIHQRI